MTEKKFDKKEYDIAYRKKHKKPFIVDLDIVDFEEINNILKENNLTKAQFLRNAIIEFKKTLKK